MQWMAIDVRQELRYKLPFLEGIAQACAEKKMHRDFCKSLSVSNETREVARKVSDQVKGFISSLCPPPPSPLPARASDGDVMDVVEPSLDAADFALVVDRVLATATSLPILPSVVPATHIHTHVQPHSQSHAQRQSSAHSQHAKHPSSFALLPHQVPVRQHIDRVGSGGLGALVFGKAFTGKTVSILHAAKGWIDAKDSLSSKANAPTYCHLHDRLLHTPYVVVLCSLQSLPKWMGVASEVFEEDWHVEVWHGAQSEGVLGQGKRLLLVVCLEVLESYLDFLTHTSAQASPKNMVCGFVVDVRASLAPPSVLEHPATFAPQSPPQPASLHDKQRCKQFLLTVAQALSPLAVPRVLVSDPALLISLDRLAVLSVLVTGMPYSALRAYVKAKGAGAVHDGSSYTTLNQLLITLTHPVTLPPEHLTQANALIREEVLGADLTP
eukprot:gene44462-54374_t